MRDGGNSVDDCVSGRNISVLTPSEVVLIRDLVTQRDLLSSKLKDWNY